MMDSFSHIPTKFSDSTVWYSIIYVGDVAEVNVYSH